METNKTPVPLGDIKEFDLKLEKPIKAEYNLEMRKLNLFTGMNGTGKTMYLVTVWCMTYIASGLLAGQLEDDEKKLYFMQFCYDRCFDNPVTTGTVKAAYESGFWLQITFKDGKVTAFESAVVDGLIMPSPPTFLSSTFRTFNVIKMYLAARKTLADKGREIMMFELSKTYKLFDIARLESLIAKMPKDTTPEMLQGLESLGIKEKIKSFNVDLDSYDFYATLEDGTTKWLSHFSAGEQSIINMILA